MTGLYITMSAFWFLSAYAHAICGQLGYGAYYVALGALWAVVAYVWDRWC